MLLSTKPNKVSDSVQIPSLDNPIHVCKKKCMCNGSWLCCHHSPITAALLPVSSVASPSQKEAGLWELRGKKGVVHTKCCPFSHLRSPSNQWKAVHGTASAGMENQSEPVYNLWSSFPTLKSQNCGLLLNTIQIVSKQESHKKIPPQEFSSWSRIKKKWRNPQTYKTL